ncbi:MULTISPECIES: type II toxin-antitoxin system PemK/MazF family toxin [Streptomyces]|uniref:Type II toxin-antitoxin system PemK/MazF family toxin n=1 Tax=Streptomyces mordarskii TaxID=1226758 RepID=A0ABP3NDG4_9ACTN|nr:type II toxin-antitoxin system PemK/MazF family toxin [Streptomyces sp. AgN23]
MVNPGTALRGEVWGCVLPSPIGAHPVVILTVNRIAEPLSAVTVAVVTGTSGPAATHLPIGSECGVTKYDESYVNCTDLHTVDKSRLRRRLGLLDPVEMRQIEDRVRVILGLS